MITTVKLWRREVDFTLIVPDRPTHPSGPGRFHDSGSSDRPTLRRAQRGEARRSEIVGDHDPGDLRPRFRPTDPLRPARDGSEAPRPTDPFWSLSGTISVKSTSRRQGDAWRRGSTSVLARVSPNPNFSRIIRLGDQVGPRGREFKNFVCVCDEHTSLFCAAAP